MVYVCVCVRVPACHKGIQQISYTVGLDRSVVVTCRLVAVQSVNLGASAVPVCIGEVKNLEPAVRRIIEAITLMSRRVRKRPRQTGNSTFFLWLLHIEATYWEVLYNLSVGSSSSVKLVWKCSVGTPRSMCLMIPDPTRLVIHANHHAQHFPVSFTQHTAQ